ncbi:patched domain-containing protein 3-like [Centruroides sculpturatus]|uniref:patched domain-containing protein 3-like n=1 Tax=Centruroides sculpturatus TaxID=218467 RepID=UPI000C6D83C2|nr:patched domain-containing protein 3-like [Centruroides sculpturatus]
MLDKDVLLEMKVTDEFIKNITVNIDGREIGYSEVCGRVNQRCFENPLIEALSEIDDIVTKNKKLKYPMDIDPLTYSYKIYSLNLGGVTVDQNDFVENVQSMRLIYFTDESDEKKEKWIEKWTMEVYKNIEKQNRTLFLLQNIKPMIGALFAFISIFAIITCMSNSWKRSKPLLGVASVVSAGLAVVSSFGLMSAFGIQSTIWNITIPFLVLVTEIDDAFVLIACWRITNPKHKVSTRMAETYCEAGVSITLTSLTNLCSYCVGMMASFPLIRMFCYYSASCIFFTFLYQITFFGGCMALCGCSEEKEHHVLPVRNLDNFEDASQQRENLRTDPMLRFFRDKLGNILSHNLVKIIVIVTYLINLAFGIWGALTIRHGLNFKNMFSDASPITESHEIYFKYFTQYMYAYQIIINKTLDYSDIKVQKSLEQLSEKLQIHPYMAESKFVVSWLNYYKEFQNHPIAKYSLSGYNMSVKEDFLEGLRNVFLRFKAAQQFSNDIVFNHNGSDIICSRFFIPVKDGVNIKTEQWLLYRLWKIAEESELPILIHSPASSAIEQAIVIGSIVNDLFWITSLIIIVLFLLAVPNIISAFLVAISVVSTMVETLGYMTMWGINLDIISLMSLVLCVGFCVNYPAHMSYAYVSSPHKIPNEKMKDSLYRIGYPVFQGSLSTVLGILFIYEDMYMLLLFVKIVCLIAMETAFHALLFIPVMHSVISSIFIKKNSTASVTEEVELMQKRIETTNINN